MSVDAPRRHDALRHQQTLSVPPGARFTPDSSRPLGDPPRRADTLRKSAAPRTVSRPSARRCAASRTRPAPALRPTNDDAEELRIPATVPCSMKYARAGAFFPRPRTRPPGGRVAAMRPRASTIPLGGVVQPTRHRRQIMKTGPARQRRRNPGPVRGGMQVACGPHTGPKCPTMRPISAALCLPIHVCSPRVDFRFGVRHPITNSPLSACLAGVHADDRRRPHISLL